MTTRTKSLATLLTAGVAVSSGAYVLGSQDGDGGAAAATAKSSTAATSAASVSGTTGRSRGPNGAPGLGRRGDGGLQTLAGRLGVSETALRDALQAIRASKTREQRRAELVRALATALKKPAADAARVRAALAKVRDANRRNRPDRRDRRDDVRQRLASALGVTADRLRTALDKVRTDQRNAFATALAQRLNIDVQKVQDVLEDLPRRGRRG